MFVQAAKTGEIDLVRGPSANVMLGQHGFYGTSSFDVILDLVPLKDVKQQRKRFEHETEQSTRTKDLSSLDIKNDLEALLTESSTAGVAIDSEYSIDL